MQVINFLRRRPLPEFTPLRWTESSTEDSHLEGTISPPFGGYYFCPLPVWQLTPIWFTCWRRVSVWRILFSPLTALRSLSHGRYSAPPPFDSRVHFPIEGSYMKGSSTLLPTGIIWRVFFICPGKASFSSSLQQLLNGVHLLRNALHLWGTSLPHNVSLKQHVPPSSMFYGKPIV